MLGKDVFDYFSEFSQYAVFGLYRNELQAHDNMQQNIFHIDVSNERELAECLQMIKPEIVINCAAVVNVDKCETDWPYALKVNGEVTTMIARSCPDIKYVYISTDSVFDGKKGNYSETDVVCPLNNYARSKLQGELNTAKMFEKHLIVRTNIFGFHAGRGSSLAEWALEELQKGNKIVGFTDVYFNPVYTKQLAVVLKQLIESNFLGTINIASRSHVSKYAFLTQLAGTFQINERLIEEQSLDNSSFQAMRPKNTTLSTNKLEVLLGDVPDLDEGISQLYTELKNIRKTN